MLPVLMIHCRSATDGAEAELGSTVATTVLEPALRTPMVRTTTAVPGRTERLAATERRARDEKGRLMRRVGRSSVTSGAGTRTSK